MNLGKQNVTMSFKVAGQGYKTNALRSSNLSSKSVIFICTTILLTTAYWGIKCDRSLVKVSVHHLADDWIRPTGMSST